MELIAEAPLTPLDRLYLARAYELAARGVGSTAPNPPVGAVIVAGGRIAGEGYHHRAGEPHAEVNALAQAGEAARGATLYVSLEPCNHAGRTPPCAPAMAEAGIVRAIVGTVDPDPRTDGGGIALLRDRGIAVVVTDDAIARKLVEPFARWVRSSRPYVALKMAMSLDGAIARQAGVTQWLTSEATRRYVRELRIAHDAVMVGAGTVRVDDPQLTVRPAHHRLRPYVRVVVCETAAVAPSRRIFESVDGYASTIVIAPAAARSGAGFGNGFAALENSGGARLAFVGAERERRLDLADAMEHLRGLGVGSVLCEGGPTLAGRLIEEGLVDRVYWAVAPVFLRGEGAVPVLAGTGAAMLDRGVRFDRVEQVGSDVMISGTFDV